ncbi:MAG: hypothetical protein K8S16_11500 [Bacteroidales bacterium]|nr:hypothetical protein [Bacteroidales bacterium]
MRSKTFYLFATLIFAVSFFIQCSSPNKNDKHNAGLQKEQKKPAEREKPKLVHDERGNVIERHAISYRKTDNSIRSNDSYYYDYDDSNNVIKEVKESYKPDGVLHFKNVSYHDFNEKGQKTKTIFESYGTEGNLNRRSHQEFKYNENGYKVEELGFFENGGIKQKIILDPDERGALRSEEYIYYTEEGAIKDHKKYFYNDYGLEKTIDLMEDPE